MVTTASTFALLAVAATGQAQAQAQAQQQQGQRAAAVEVQEEIVVTGSRIVRDGYEAPTPVSVLSAEELMLSPKTVSVYRARVLEKLGLTNNSELTVYAIRNGLVAS